MIFLVWCPDEGVEREQAVRVETGGGAAVAAEEWAESRAYETRNFDDCFQVFVARDDGTEEAEFEVDVELVPCVSAMRVQRKGAKAARTLRRRH